MTVGLGADVVVAVLGAALLHATWNAIAHGMSDRLAGFTLIALSYTAIGGVAALCTGPPPAAAWPLILASAGVHVAYQVALMLSYRLGQFSQVYPLARGTAPWVVTVLSYVVLRQGVSGWVLAGVLVISAGLTGLVFLGGRPTRRQVPALAAAFGTGLLIATYTVIDGVGVHRADVLTYAAWMFLLQGVAVVLLAQAVRGRALFAQLRVAPIPGLAGGTLSLIAYGLVLWAQTRGALAPIAALRETSIIFGALIGAVFFRESLGRGRALAGAVVLAGIVLINLP
ncbi:DMT family transporter [Saccharopolyspora gloriosae]|uniref:Drug/metabolite transporter (DMT)-like permease n=1 Tax=Saccharopolyspora gloriosae TaxID=455344 RepID=A0A840NF13_9PSEU|nr:EamA family transporter [Saccharopolyspora gloriosae]MBB5068675.1 drug/metabolite transporter (DMT)-like permease [Saccharopolyspora gloriosae]